MPFSPDIHFLQPDSEINSATEVMAFCKQWQDGESHFVLNTSGSTGQPKPINIHRRQMLASAQATIKALGLKKGDKALICLNTNFIGGKMMLVRGLEAELAMTIIPPVGNPLDLIEENARFDFTSLVPYQLQNVLEQSPEKLPILNGMKGILLGGAPVSSQLESKIQSIEAPIYSTYGMTETVSHIALRRLNGKSPEQAFTALPGIEIALDQDSCLRIKGAATEFEWIQTRDLVELIAADKFVWIGRADNIINSGGIKIQTDKLEKTISEVFSDNNLTNRFFVYGIPDERFGTVAVLFFEGELSEDIKALLWENFQQRLNKYEIPKNMVAIKKFTETASGKIDRKASVNS